MTSETPTPRAFPQVSGQKWPESKRAGSEIRTRDLRFTRLTRPDCETLRSRRFCSSDKDSGLCWIPVFAAVFRWPVVCLWSAGSVV